MIRPSSLPMLDQCPCWEGSEAIGYNDKDAGTNRHRLATAFLGAGEAALEGIAEDEAEKVRWACNYLRDHAPMTEYPLRIEERRIMIDSDFTELMSGTPDVTCGPTVFDFKSRPRDYRLQMAAYALMVFQDCGWPRVTVHLLFCETGKPEVYSLTKAEAEKLVVDVLAKVKASNPQPVPCDYCGWCARNLTCPALLNPALEIAKARGAEAADVERFASFIGSGAHPSLADTADMMGSILRIMRHVAVAVKSAEHHAKEMAVKHGIVPTGFKVTSKSGKTFVTDATTAFSLAGLPQETFLSACGVRLNTSKKYPDQMGLIDLAAKFNGVKKAQAKRDLIEKLQPVIQQGAASIVLKAVNNGVDEEENEE